MARYLYGDESFTPQSILDEGSGLRPSFERLLQLIDITDDAWPATADVLREMMLAGVELDDATICTAVKLGRARWSQTVATLHDNCYEAPTLASAADAIVYYVRRGRLIKIGTTADPVDRFTTLMPDEILAFEPGSYEDETIRHRQFAHLRCQGEHFQAAPELLAHIRIVRDKYGDPDPAWPTSTTLLVPTGIPASPPRTAELMSAREALEQLGIPYTTLRIWVRRGVLRRAGREGAKYLYYADQLRELQPRCRKLAAS